MKTIFTQLKTNKQFLILFGFVLITSFVDAQKTATTSGAWGNVGTWTPIGVPGNTETVIIPSGITVNLNVNSANLTSLTINAGGILTTATNTLSATTMTVNGTLTRGGTGAITSTTMTVGSTGIYTHAINGGTIPTAIWNAASTMEITGVTTTLPGGRSQNFGNFVWDCLSQTAALNLSASPTTINGNFSINNTNTGFLEYANSPATLSIAGNLNISNGTFRLANGANDNVTVNLTGNINLSGGTLDMVNAGNGATSGTINLSGDFTHTSGSIIKTSSNSSATIVFNKTGTQIFRSGGTVGAIDFTVNNGSLLQMFNATSSVTGTGVFTLSSGASLGITSPVGITTAGATGNIQNTGTRTYSLSGNYTYNGTANQVFGNGLPNNLTGTLTINNPGNTVTLDNPFTIASGGNFIVNSGSFLQILNATTNVTGAGAFTLSSGASLGITSPVGITSSGATGNIQTTTRTYNAGANYVYNGTANQTIGNGFPNNLTGILTINNPGNTVTLDNPRTIASGGNLTLTNGLLTTTSTNLLTIAAGGSASFTNGSTTSFVNGPMAKIGNTVFTFPVGKSGAGMRAISISTSTDPATTFRGEFNRAAASNRGAVGTGITQISACEHWLLDRTTGAGNVNVTLSWSSASPCNGALYVTNLNDLRVARYNGTQWVDAGNASTTGDNANGTITSNPVTSFSPFALAGSKSGTNPLPVKFTDVKAFEKGNAVQIEWTNQTESDMVNYLVERSLNGYDFSIINTVDARSNLSSKESYISMDAEPSTGVNYYRIKAVEVSGKLVYSNTVKVVKGAKQQELLVYPNPVKNNNIVINFTAPKGTYNVNLFNAAGQQVMRQQLNHPGGPISQTIDLPFNTQSGMYNLQIIGDNYRANKILIVQK